MLSQNVSQDAGENIKQWWSHIENPPVTQKKIYKINENIVIKIVKRQSIQQKVCEKLFEKEQPYIVKILSVEKATSNLCGIGMQNYPQNLKQFLVSKRLLIRQNPLIAVDIVMQICFGLINLQKMHRDLKPSNILIKIENNRGKDKVKVVLADFETCNTGQRLNRTVLGTQIYMAPQMKQNYNLQTTLYNSLVDVWSLGLVIFQIFGVLQANYQINCLFPQFPLQFQHILANQNMNQEISQQIITFIAQNPPLISQKVPHYIRHLMRRIINPSPAKRPKLSEILQFLQQFFVQINDSSNQMNKFQLKSHIQLKKYIQIQKNIEELQLRNWYKLSALYVMCHQIYYPLIDIQSSCMKYRKLAIILVILLVGIEKLYKQIIQINYVCPEYLNEFLFPNKKWKNKGQSYRE